MDPDQLEQIPFFAELTLDQREHVAEACAELEIEEGATLLREGDFGYAMFAITSGVAEVLRNGVVIRTRVRAMPSARLPCSSVASEPPPSSPERR